MIRSRCLAFPLLVIAALTTPEPATAASTNDSYASATVIGSLPFSETISTATATAEAEEPSPCFAQPSNSVWYTYRPPSDQTVLISTSGSSYDAFAQLYVVGGPGFAGLLPSRCQSNSRPVDLAGGTMYAIQVTDEAPLGGGGTLILSIQQALPPANDDFGSATSVTTLPFTERIDLTAATLEANEPPATNCLSFPPLIASAWYAFTPAVDGQFQILTDAGFEHAVAIYTGSSVGALMQIGCGSGAIAVQAGTTYYVQIAAQSLGKGAIDVTMRQPPAPLAGLGFDPSEPSSIDPVSFFDQTFDPGFREHSSRWTFGDGSTSNLSNPTHRYTADGDYLVGLTVTTLDGRTGSTQQAISVRTHDVRIKSVSAPKSARRGQTRSIAVSVVDRRYPETVEVRLYRVDSAGQTLIGDTFLDLRVTPRATTTSFPYRFTAADAAAGRVSFLATVDIVGHSDALPADNSGKAATSVKR